MGFLEKNMDNIINGAFAGATIGIIHALIAGLIIAPIMTGTIFYSYEGNLIIAMLVDVIRDIALGGAMGAIGAFLALYLAQQKATN